MARRAATRDRLWSLLSDRTVPVSFEVPDAIPAGTVAAMAVETGVPPRIEVALGPPSRAERWQVT